MRYNLILFVMILVSQVYCNEEYWMDDAGNFKWYGSRTLGWLGTGEQDAKINFSKGRYSFRPTVETATSAEPKIVIDFEFFSKRKNNILVQKITLDDTVLDDTLKAETKIMGKIMVSIFIREIGWISDEREEIKNHEMLRMLHSFAFELNQTEIKFTKAQKETLVKEFANGMNDGLLCKDLDYPATHLKDDQIKSVINLTKLTYDLAYVGSSSNGILLRYKTGESIAFIENENELKTDFNKLKLPFGQYFFNLFVSFLSDITKYGAEERAIEPVLRLFDLIDKMINRQNDIASKDNEKIVAIKKYVFEIINSFGMKNIDEIIKQERERMPNYQKDIERHAKERPGATQEIAQERRDLIKLEENLDKLQKLSQEIKLAPGS